MVTTGPTSAQALEVLRQEGTEPDHVATDLSHAVTWVFGHVEKAMDRASGQASIPFGG